LKTEKLYFKIGEISRITGIKPYILRYWESEFNLLNPTKTQSKHRLYNRRDLDIILKLKKLLYEDRFTIEGARKKINELKRSKQLRLEFLNSLNKEIIEEVKKELKDIKEMLKKEY
jgi:DNA-binding transcriptional MerR regulator